MQNSTLKEYGDLIALRDEKKRYLNSTNKNLDELLKNELNHEEPPWRTPVTKGWWDRMKEERIRWALQWYRWGFRWDGQGNWTPEKKRWKHLELEFIHEEQTPKEGITHLGEIRIRFMVCLSFIKLNWWQAMDFTYYLFFLKGLRGNSTKLEKVFMNHR